MNPLLIIRLVKVFNDYRKQISEEAEKFDKEHQIDSPKTRVISHIVMGIKVLCTAAILGELPIIDLFPSLVAIQDKLAWIGVIGVLGTVMFCLLFFMSYSEKDHQRDDV